jgi:hypothetical protein
VCAQPFVGGVDFGDPGERQLLGQAVLQRAEEPLRAPARLRRIGGDMLDAELRQGPADLGGMLPVDPAAGSIPPRSV